MNVLIETLGCRLNEAEVQRWTHTLTSAGHRLVDEPTAADVIVVNTCAVTREATRKSRQRINRLQRRNPQAKLVVSGCYATLSGRRSDLETDVDLIVPNAEKDALVERISQLQAPATSLRPKARAGNVPALDQRGRTRAFVKVQDGCRHRCTYCVVTLARGDERSRQLMEIVAEVDRLVHDGYQEIVLTGVHLGGYGNDLGGDLEQLVRTLLEQPALRRLRLSSLEPWNIPPRFWELWKDRRLCPHLHLPLQSGSNRVLKRMARRGDRRSYLELIASARRAVPEMVVTTDVIVGFPGETAEDIEATIDVCRRAAFAHIHVFPYSARPGTVAASFTQTVTREEQQKRAQALRSVADELRQATFQRFVGSTREVLWESCEPIAGSTHQRWRGLTDNYLRVETVGGADEDLRNLVTQTRLTAYDSGSLRGEIVK